MNGNPYDPNQPYGGPPPGGYGVQPGYGPPPPGMGPPAGGMGMMQAPGMGATPYAPYGVDPVSGMPFSDKQKSIAGLLGIFGGAFGAGRFYTGHVGIAVAQIAVSWLTCGLGVFWPIIDGIMLMSGRATDAQGRPLRD